MESAAKNSPSLSKAAVDCQEDDAPAGDQAAMATQLVSLPILVVAG